MATSVSDGPELSYRVARVLRCQVFHLNNGKIQSCPLPNRYIYTLNIYFGVNAMHEEVLCT